MPAQPLDYSPAVTRFPSPWVWIPVAYFMQAVPNVLATSVFPLAFRNLGVEVVQIAAWTPIIALPWTLKLLWSPVVDLTGTKRSWVLAMQALVFATAAMAAVGLMLPQAFAPVVAVLLLMAFCAATHDVALDGLYLMSLSQKRQAAFVGVISTSFRLGRLFCTGVVVAAAGFMQSAGWGGSAAWAAVLGATAVLYGSGLAWNLFALPRTADSPRSEPAENLPRLLLSCTIVLLMGVSTLGVVHGLVRIIGDDLGKRLAGLGSDIYGGSAAKWIQTSDGLAMWQLILFIGAVISLALYPVARKLLPRTEVGRSLGAYLTQPGIAGILFFILTYRVAEVMVGFISPLFLADSAAAGGLALSLQQIGAITGFAGVVGIILGGLVGGAFISKVGLRAAFWPLVLAMALPNLFYVYAAHLQPTGGPDLWLLYLIAFVDQFGYGVGFAGYSVYLMYVAQRTAGGQYATTHYAIGTGLGALLISFAIAGAGILHSALGYYGFFIAACVLTLPGMAALYLIPLDETQGKGIKAEEG
jgi:MFS transporter, PAT family, beta-lactamase induction signal transducer AmpG